MALTKHHMPGATALSALLRKLAIASFAGGLITVAAVPTAYADSAAAPTVATDSATVVQHVNNLPPSRSEEGARAPAQISREYLIKAALLYNFAKFAEWPAASFANDSDTLRICVLGDDPFGPALGSINGRTVRDRTLLAAPIARIEDAAACHILFVSASERDRLATILDTVGELPVLTVADMGRFTSSGGIVALKTAEDRSRLEINVGAAKRAGVRLSSKLLRLADTVSTQTAQVPAK